MNEKKAKQLRKVARWIATQQGYPDGWKEIYKRWKRHNVNS